MHTPSPRRWLAVALFMLASCGGSGGSPAAPAATPPATSWFVSGQVVSMDSGAGVSGAAITPGWSLALVTADANGNYKFGDSTTPPQAPMPVTASGDSMVSRDVFINFARPGRTGVEIDLIHNVPPFSMDYYRQLVRGTFDQPGAPFPVLRWVTAPSFYIRTMDDAGNPVPQSVINVIVDGINRAVPAWSGGQYTPAAIQTGTDVRSATVNWINLASSVKTDPTDPLRCGQSFVGDNPGQITLWENVCPCAVIPGQVVVHEVGHAMGFFHVNDRTSVMNPTDVEACPNTGVLSPADGYHASIAYSRPRGNTDPDHDPGGGVGILRAANLHIRVY